MSGQNHKNANSQAKKNKTKKNCCLDKEQTQFGFSVLLFMDQILNMALYKKVAATVSAYGRSLPVQTLILDQQDFIARE